MTHSDSGSPMPGTPPDLSGSKSSKSSSYHSSFQSEDHSILSDVANFEVIGLDDDQRPEAEIREFLGKKSVTNLYDASLAFDLRTSARDRRIPITTVTAGFGNQRDLTVRKSKPSNPSLRGHIMRATDGLGLLPVNNGRKASAPTSPPHTFRQNRSVSPKVSNPRHNLTTYSSQSPYSLKSRRLSSQSIRDRKTIVELEKECDEDNGDDVPDECFLENIPISPRPPSERFKSTSTSASTSPERPAKGKVKHLGNGTSAQPAEQGELRSPRASVNRTGAMKQFPIHHQFKSRAKSWTAAMSDLSAEVKALTEALEAHEAEYTRVTAPFRQVEKQRTRSALAELPPLRRSDIMIDPLPISKEKEAVLSRTRPSWLPPKNPAEEKRHLKEYQKMMASSLEAEKKKEVEKLEISACRDDTAKSLLKIWEEHVLPNWNDTIRQKRMRELWWRGVSPRSRGGVWAKAIGNKLGLTDASYTAALRRAQALELIIKSESQLTPDEEKKKCWLDSIESDVKKTYSELRIFQPNGPLHNALMEVLKAYSMYRSDVGYVSGTSTVAAILLLNLPTPSSSFIALSNILNRPLPMSFHTSDAGATQRAHSLLLSTLKLKSPRLHAHLTSPPLNHCLDQYFRDYFTSMGTALLGLDQAARLWDIMVFEGDGVLVRAGVAYLMGLEGKLFGADNPRDVREVIRAGAVGLTEEDWIASVRNAGKL